MNLNIMSTCVTYLGLRIFDSCVPFGKKIKPMINSGLNEKKGHKIPSSTRKSKEMGMGKLGKFENCEQF